MPSVCFYFQIHQPYRLRRYSVFDTGRDYWDEPRNADFCRRIAQRCYLPAGRLLLDVLRQQGGKFRFAFSVTGLVLEQFRTYAPEVIDLLAELGRTGCVEFLSETYHHSLAFFYSPDEFREQVEQHRKLIHELFGQTPRVFRNTELTYNNDLARFAGEMGYGGILTEGADQILGARSPNYVYRPPGQPNMRVLLKNYRLSDDIAFRFSDRGWAPWPLTADKFAQWVTQINGNGQVCNLFMDFEVFGEHQRGETGIFEFMRHVPTQVLRASSENDFLTPSQAIDKYEPAGELDVPQPISWADTERDLSAWRGNAMQSNALHELFRIEKAVKERGDPYLLSDWRRLTCSDHFYYMSTKRFADGAVHRYFSPYESPYDGYINFMNVLDNVRARMAE